MDTDNGLKKRKYKTNGVPRSKDEPLSKKGERSSKTQDIILSKTFKPRFLDDADQRFAVVRTIKKRVEALMQDAGGYESTQRAMLVKHAVFLHVLLETLETKAAQEGELDMGQFVQAINSLVGLLRILGLEKRIKRAGGLKEYLEERK